MLIDSGSTIDQSTYGGGTVVRMFTEIAVLLIIICLWLVSHSEGVVRLLKILFAVFKNLKASVLRNNFVHDSSLLSYHFLLLPWKETSISGTGPR